MGKKSNIKGGNKHKKYAKERDVEIKLNINELDKTDNQEFAFVLNMLGNKRVELQCYDKKKRIGLIRGSKRNMSKRNNWITNKSLVLISLRTFSTIDDKCDVIKLYNQDEVNFLLQHKKIPFNFVKNGSFKISNQSDDQDSVAFIDSNQNYKKKHIKNERNYDDLYNIMDEESHESEGGDINIDYI